MTQRETGRNAIEIRPPSASFPAAPGSSSESDVRAKTAGGDGEKSKQTNNKELLRRQEKANRLTMVRPLTSFFLGEALAFLAGLAWTAVVRTDEKKEEKKKNPHRFLGGGAFGRRLGLFRLGRRCRPLRGCRLLGGGALGATAFGRSRLFGGGRLGGALASAARRHDPLLLDGNWNLRFFFKSQKFCLAEGAEERFAEWDSMEEAFLTVARYGAVCNLFPVVSPRLRWSR